MPVIRPAEPGDLREVAAIQAASPEAAHWNITDYLQHDFRVAAHGIHLQGFLVARQVAEGEYELLNVAVLPEFRRQGVGRALVESLLNSCQGTVYLEVRASNRAAQEFYKGLGFEELSTRPAYYDSPPEAAIVMKFHSC
jgi:[ribosomal protein S18]-alanine N-acetyltransferase